MVLGRKIFDTLKESYTEDNNTAIFTPVSHEEFLESVFDSIYYTESLFKDLNTRLCITEAEELMVLDVKSEDKIKKTIIQTIKELFAKFVDFLKTQFHKFAEWLKNMYMNTNVADSVMSKIGKGITFDNIKTARSKGWKGCPVNLPCINPYHIEDSEAVKAVNAEFKQKEYYTLAEKMLRADTIEDAKEIFNDIKEKSKETKSSTRKRNPDNVLYTKNYRDQLKRFSDEEIKLFVYTYKNGKEAGYYYPEQDGFNNVKYMAEHGESYIKKYRVELKKFADKIEKTVVEPEINNMNSFKMGGGNESADKTTDQINILYHQARVYLGQIFLKAYGNAIGEVIAFLKFQHQTAIKTYLYWIMSTKKYVTESTEIDAEDYLFLV